MPVMCVMVMVVTLRVPMRPRVMSLSATTLRRPLTTREAITAGMLPLSITTRMLPFSFVAARVFSFSLATTRVSSMPLSLAVTVTGVFSLTAIFPLRVSSLFVAVSAFRIGRMRFMGIVLAIFIRQP